MNSNDKAKALVQGVSKLLQCRRVSIPERGDVCGRHSALWTDDGCNYALHMALTEAMELEAQGWDIVKADVDPYHCFKCNTVHQNAKAFIKHLREEHAEG